MSKRVALLAVLLLTSLPASSQEVCPCPVLSYTWVATACETWNCAASAMIVANGDPMVMSIPTGGSQYKWIILKRMVTGSAIVSPDEPFLVDSYTTATDAAVHLGTLDGDMLPMLVTTVDGTSLVIRLKKADPLKRRAVRR